MSAVKRVPKPEWLKVKKGDSSCFSTVSSLVQKGGLHTICTSGRCPNLAECWGKGTATFMIGGEICTRSCKFCNTQTGKPLPLDRSEPEKIASAVAQLQLKHAVITSVDRDDLPDLGANHWVETVQKIKAYNPGITIEILIPDFQGREQLLEMVVQSAPNIISHNMETVERLTPLVRSAACYDKSLQVLSFLASKGVVTKSGLMLGLGETFEEVVVVMDDLRKVGCRILTLGQYLQPTKHHLPVENYIHPDVFLQLKNIALEKGFYKVESGPLVRSSYHAHEHL